MMSNVSGPKVGRVTKVLLFSALSVLLLPPAISIGQVRPVNDHGALGLGRLLKRLNTTASVMMIGAHPDDEDSALLAYLARGENARTAYLSLTRGDGGQNIIGPELFESLGVIRTEELLQARRLDGGEQYFTRAFDYGFSKTLAEAKQKWNEKVILCDAVRAIRSFRPLVLISRFSGTAADGHGHHQFAGYISPLAVKAAADPQQCTQSGVPWQVLKFYVEQGFGDNLPPPTLRINTGQYDPLLGRSYFEIAMEGRSQHKSQGEGRIEFHGDQFSGLNLVESKVGKPSAETGIFDGIDTTITGTAKLMGVKEDYAANHFGKIRPLTEKALNDLKLADLRKILPTLVAGYREIHESLKFDTVQDPGQYDFSRGTFQGSVLKQKEAQQIEAIAKAAGLQVDALADRELVVPGETFSAFVKAYFPKTENLTVKEIALVAPSSWQVAKVEPPKENTSAFNRRELANQAEFFTIQVPANARPTQPYWLVAPRDGDLFRWPDDERQNMPFESQNVLAKVTLSIDETDVTFEWPLQFRYADPSRGEIRRNVDLAPQLSVSLDQKLLIISQSDKPQVRRIVMNITNNSTRPVNGIPGLNFNSAATWKYSMSPAAFSLKNKGDRASISFEVTIPPGVEPGTYEVYGQAPDGEAVASGEMHTLSYPHIQTHRFYTRAQTDISVLDLKVENIKIGYVMGSGDEVPDAIRRMGLEVTMLEEKDLASGDLSAYDTIVIGIRASETRPDLIANNQRLLDYVKNGGNVLMQYQRANFGKSGLPPFPVDTADKQGTAAGSVARVVDENAAVKILEPQHPIFNIPNKITDSDFIGWVQERNAYNLVTFDPQYASLLESHDAGEQENNGGLVIAQLGKGTWMYCSYSFFRQLPAGVGGAYRLFANILSLPKARPR